MEAYAGEWVQLLLRFAHVIAAIAWIGASFYFVFLDNNLKPPVRSEDADAGVGGELWAIHGGGFYRAEKYRVAPKTLPATLHWFRWEAYTTWLTGFALFVAMYWLHADVYMIDRSVADIARWQACAISGALLVAGWIFYDQLCKRLGLERDALIAVLMIAFVALCAFGLSHVFSGRALYLQIGAMLGTIMVANVGHVIIPGQRRLVAAAKADLAPDPVDGLRGKQRSVHNNYLTLPVLFTMLSGHYPMTFAHPRAWMILVAALIIAAFVRHFFNLRHRGRTVWAIPIVAAVAVLAVAIASAPAVPSRARAVRFADVERIVALRCTPCHAANPRQEGIAAAPKGVLLDSPAEIERNAQKIGEQAVQTRAMPIGNVTGMTDDERATLATWIAAGAPASP
jgi:uncharacterized membrane protein